MAERDFRREIAKFGLTIDQYEKCLQDIKDKQNGLNDLDYSEIKEKYGIKAHYDSIRKASSTIFGGVFVADYLSSKNTKKNENSMEDIKNIIGKQTLLKKQLQKEKREINKFKNDLVKVVAVADDIKEYFTENPVVFYPTYPKVDEDSSSGNDSAMILTISDWHIGLVINNCSNNLYNYSIAKERTEKLIYEVIKYIRLYNVKEVYVVNLGDMVENSYMRKNQSQYCEFGLGEQVVKATLLIFSLLKAISNENVQIIYDGVAGNHDRFTSDKTENLDGDNVNAIITPVLQNFVQLSETDNITIISRDLYGDSDIEYDVQGVPCKFTHGHKHGKNGKTNLINASSVDDVFYKIYFQGHWHNFNVSSENNGRYVVTNGCLSGYNDYSYQFGCATVASQSFTIISNGKIELIKDVQLV